MIRNRKLMSPCLLAASLALFLTAVQPAGAQQPGTGWELRVIPLKHAQAREVARSLDTLFESEPIVVSFDERLNALVVRALSDQWDKNKISDVIESLDAPAEEPPLEIKIFTLRNIAVDSSLADIAGVVAPADVSIALDAKTNSVIVKGPADSLAVIEALLLRLDAAPEQARGQGEPQMQVRIVWLVKGLEREGAPPPPEDLKNVVEELGKIGVSDLRLAAQVVLSADLESEFTTEGSALLEGPCRLQISGLISQAEAGAIQGAESSRGGGRSAFGTIAQPAVDAKRHPRLRLSIFAASGPEELSRMETTIAAPFGHSVVLGVTPMKNMTSVFVVQILPQAE